MLSALKKVLSAVNKEGNLENAGAEQALLENEDGSMSVITAEMFSEVSTKLEEALKGISEKDTVISGLNEKLAQFETTVAELSEKANIAEASAKAKDVEERKAALAAVLGSQNEKLGVLLESTKELPRESFNIVVEGLKTSFKQEGESADFKELGAEGKAETTEVTESAEMKILKQKYVA